MDVSTGDRTIAIEVRFSSHCFTEKAGPDDAPDLLYIHAQERRRFDLIRYELSKRLPDLIRQLPGKSVYRSQTSNFFFLRATKGTEYPGPYVVFFNMRKARQADIDLLMRIESAYAKPNMTTRASAVRFERLALSCATGRQIPVAPRKSSKENRPRRAYLWNMRSTRELEHFVLQTLGA